MEEKEKKKEEQKEPEIVELGQKQLAELIATAVEEKTKAIVDEVKELRKDAAHILPEPDVKEEEKEKIYGRGIDESNYEEVIKEFNAKLNEKVQRDREVPKNEFSFVRFLWAQKTGDWKHAPYERAAWEASQQKALTWASGSGGGYWVDAEFLPEEFINYFAAQIVCRKAGCKVLQATGSPVNIPKITAGATAYWVDQNATITASDQTPAQLQLTPHWCVARTQLSRFLVRSSQGAAEQIVRQDIAQKLARAVDDAMLEGTGSNSQPTGMASTAGINTVAIGTNGGAITFDKLREMLYKLQEDDVPLDGVVWVMNPRTWWGITQLTVNSEDNHFVFNPSQQLTEAMKLYGFPVYLSTQVAIDNTKGTGEDLANIFLVKMTDIILCEWGGIEVEATDVGGDAWAKNLIEVKATYTVDVGVRHPTAVCLISDSTT